MKRFTGTWNVVSSPNFAQDHLCQEGPPYVRLRQQGDRVEGEYAFGLEHGHIDGRPEGEDRIVFSFEGMDAEKLVNGAGIAVVQEDRLRIRLFYHFGPDRTLEGTRPTAPKNSADADG